MLEGALGGFGGAADNVLRILNKDRREQISLRYQLTTSASEYTVTERRGFAPSTFDQTPGFNCDPLVRNASDLMSD